MTASRDRAVQILVSPYGAAEWSEQDLEAVLCGCLLVKVNAGAIVTYPDVFRPKAHVLPTSSEFSSLEDTLLTALQVSARLACAPTHPKKTDFAIRSLDAASPGVCFYQPRNRHNGCPSEQQSETVGPLDIYT